jgi:hypothetical protein
VEANPLAEAIGVPGKLVVVAAAGWVLARIRPVSLLVPIAVLAVVVVWSAVGLLLTA